MWVLTNIVCVLLLATVEATVQVYTVVEATTGSHDCWLLCVPAVLRGDAETRAFPVQLAGRPPPAAAAESAGSQEAGQHHQHVTMTAAAAAITAPYLSHVRCSAAIPTYYTYILHNMSMYVP